MIYAVKYPGNAHWQICEKVLAKEYGDVLQIPEEWDVWSERRTTSFVGTCGNGEKVVRLDLAPTDTAADLEAVARAALEAAAKLVPVIDDFRHASVSIASTLLSERRCAIRALDPAAIVAALAPAPDPADAALPLGHVVLEQTDTIDGRISQTVRDEAGNEYERILKQRPEPADAALSALPARVSVAEAARPSQGAVVALSSYQQADADGIMVLVSRQAIEECLPALRALASAEGGEA
ncbi:hypothetical protein EU805_01615 [Salipiger sp. IMCC34102]|uniref:hypothetical protein n=1 Tax=Salipiger sp. IMCC34102 TaxID=2510647 RepID=UPI00101D9506|nr:hypothetical protein [Salipiger sp. IMCC34102]RYH04095.1 hypothetical protein EU805_01615 [Salipiger sp. IMCC34102]